MELITAPTVVMADHPNLQDHLRRELEWDFSQGPVDLRYVRSLVSSPRLRSLFVRVFSHCALAEAGDTFLDSRTLLADYPQKTMAISLTNYLLLEGTVEVVDKYSPSDASVMKLQVWPFEPGDLNEFAMAVAVALSYTPAELMAESRISAALDDLVSEWGYYTDEF
ncbi:hypothetical protein HP062_24585 [Pseudomonas sp. B14-6]|uniref:hypothetical protein n=1 Tax=Pseudomonas sp. B14-6 TaxID=2738843 RepID=UPI00155E517F|nr:hypothetical protein [Pseudomonas sp. B14-6]QKG68526.1 hypothetical protein HP062_24585 [Pseudomonas sp. B14-6]